MRHSRSNRPFDARSQSGGLSPDPRPEVVGSEDLHIRNYDHQWGYDLTIEALTPGGEAVFAKRYYLQPGRVESELDVLPAGQYDVRATLDNHKRVASQCRVDADPAHTVVIEVGNGALSLTQGLSS